VFFFFFLENGLFFEGKSINRKKIDQTSKPLQIIATTEIIANEHCLMTREPQAR